VLESGQGASLVDQADVIGTIWSDSNRQEFEGTIAMQACVFGTVDHTHATSPYFGDDPIMGNGLANHGRSPSWISSIEITHTIPHKRFFGKVLIHFKAEIFRAIRSLACTARAHFLSH
jgi:hypothetical protein